VSDENVSHVTRQEPPSGAAMFWPALFLVMLLVMFTLVEGWAATAIGDVKAQESLAKSPDETWIFAVPGDSRNCGDVVMPAIVEGARARSASSFTK
jgi:hypothetical protein